MRGCVDTDIRAHLDTIPDDDQTGIKDRQAIIAAASEIPPCCVKKLQAVHLLEIDIALISEDDIATII